MEGIEHKTIHVNGINMHVAEKGEGPVILLLHGFPELWYSWRHQILILSSLGYRALAPDLRGYGDTDAPESVDSYTCFHIVGDLIALLDALALDQKQVFVVGHDWGAIIAWYLCLFRPDRVKALLNLSVPFLPIDPIRKLVPGWRAYYGDDYYMWRFQEPGKIEEEFAELGIERTLRELLTFSIPGPILLPKGNLFGHPPDTPIVMPSWLSEEDLQFYVSKFEKKGFTGPVNFYRNLDRNSELLAPWVGSEIKVPTKFIMGDLDLVYHMPGIKQYVNDGFKKDVPLLEDVVVMEGVTHWINQEKGEEISNHIYDFFQKFR